MPLQLKEVSTDAEFARVMEALFDAYSYPYDGFWVICKGSSEQECVSRFNKWRKQDPNAHWIYVTDTETDEVVGATQWNIYESSPSEDPRSELQGDWLEEGNVDSLLMTTWTESVKAVSYVISSKKHSIIISRSVRAT